MQFPDPLFGNPILVVGIDTCKAETLIVGLAALLPSVGGKDPIVSMIELDIDAVIEAEVFEYLLA